MKHQRWYKPFNLQERASLDELQNMVSAVEEIWNKNNPEPHEFIVMGKFAIANSEILKPNSELQVKTATVKVKKDKTHSFPEDLRETIKKLKEQYNLKDKEIVELAKVLNKKEFEKLTLKQKIETIEKNANIKHNEREQEKLYKKFKQTYENFYECLEPNLKEIDQELRKDIKAMLENISGVIKKIEPNL